MSLLTGKQFSRISKRFSPRVGKVEVQESHIISQVQALMEDKKIRRIIVCRGTNRTIGPPSDLTHGEVPYRRNIFTERNAGKNKANETWESWEDLSKRRLIRASHPCRPNMTVFACNTDVPSAARESRVDRPVQPASNSQSAPQTDDAPAEGSKNSTAEDTASPNPEVTLTESQRADLESVWQTAHVKSITKEEQQAPLVPIRAWDIRMLRSSV